MPTSTTTTITPSPTTTTVVVNVDNLQGPQGPPGAIQLPLYRTAAPVNGVTDAADGQLVRVSAVSGVPPFTNYLCRRNGALSTTTFELSSTRSASLFIGSFDPLTLAQISAKPSNAVLLRKYLVALAKVRSGDRRNARVMCIGDSVTAGAGSPLGASGGVINYVGCTPFSYPAQIAKILTLRGIPAFQSGIFGKADYHGSNTTVAQNDPRWSLGTGWAQGVWALTLGGTTLVNTNTTNPASFTPASIFDTIELWYQPIQPIAINIGGGTIGTAPSTGANTTSYRLQSCARGLNTVNFVPNGGFLCGITGVNTYDSTIPAVSIIQTGWGGAKTGDFLGGDPGVNPNVTNALISRDLTIVMLGLNDANQNVSAVNYIANMTQICSTSLAAGGSMIIVGPTPSNIAPALISQYLAPLQALAASIGAVFINPADRFVNVATFEADGLITSDLTHPNKNGYAAIAEMIADAMTGY